MKNNFRFKPLAVLIGLSLVLSHTAFAAEDYPGIEIVNGKAENNKGKIAQIKAEAESADQYILGLIDDISQTEGQVYSWGETGPDGGIVFYVDGSGQHGLEAQEEDNNGDGLSWSDAIAAAASYNNTDITIELDCSDTDFPSTPNCWHLPSKTELQYLYEQRNVVGGFANYNDWSSAQGDSGIAWGQYFGSGYQNGSSEDSTGRVRAVRAF